MSAGLRVALACVRLVTALIPDPHLRARYREEWESELREASDVGLRPLGFAVGLTVAALRLSLATRKGPAMVPIGPLALALHLIGGEHARRRAFVLALLFGLLLLLGIGVLLAT